MRQSLSDISFVRDKVWPLLRPRQLCKRARAILCLSLAALTLTAGGCAYLDGWMQNHFKVGPEYRKPAAPVADQWIDFNDPRVISDSLGVNDEAWWEVFNDPFLDDLVPLAYEENLPLRAAGMRVLEARAQRAIAAGNLFPQSQEALGQYQRIQISTNGNPAGVTMLPARAFSLWTSGFNATWEIDLWGRLRRGIESADANLDASIEDYDDVLVSLIAETAAAYVDVRAFQQRLEFARANVAAQEGSLRIAESRLRAGAVSELDVTQARSILGQTEALIPVLERGLRLSNNRLCVLLGIPPRDLVEELGTEPIPSAEPEVVVGIPAELLRRRPDVRRAEREVAAQSAQIGIAAADFFPTFAINGTLTWAAGTFDGMFNSSSQGGVIGPTFNWKILNYGRILNNVRVQETRFQRLAIEYQQTVLNANAEIEDAIVSFLRAQEEVRALERSVAATARSVEIVLKQYQEGAVDFNRVFNLQSTLVTQQDQLAESEANVALSLIGIYRTLGGGWQIRNGYRRPARDVEMGEEIITPPPAEEEIPNDRPGSGEVGDRELSLDELIETMPISEEVGGGLFGPPPAMLPDEYRP